MTPELSRIRIPSKPLNLRRATLSADPFRSMGPPSPNFPPGLAESRRERIQPYATAVRTCLLSTLSGHSHGSPSATTPGFDAKLEAMSVNESGLALAFTHDDEICNSLKKLAARGGIEPPARHSIKASR